MTRPAPRPYPRAAHACGALALALPALALAQTDVTLTGTDDVEFAGNQTYDNVFMFDDSRAALRDVRINGDVETNDNAYLLVDMQGPEGHGYFVDGRITTRGSSVVDYYSSDIAAGASLSMFDQSRVTLHNTVYFWDPVDVNGSAEIISHGGGFSSALYLRDHARATLHGGSAQAIDIADNARVEYTDGFAYNISASGNSELLHAGGETEYLVTSNASTLTFTGGTVFGLIHEAQTQATVSGGDIENLDVLPGASINVTGGTIQALGIDDTDGNTFSGGDLGNLLLFDAARADFNVLDIRHDHDDDPATPSVSLLAADATSFVLDANNAAFSAGPWPDVNLVQMSGLEAHWRDGTVDTFNLLAPDGQVDWFATGGDAWTGSITFRLVPAPSGFALFGGLLTLRRRRRVG